MIMAEKLNEIDIDITEKTPEMTPYAGALPFMQMCEDMYLPGISPMVRRTYREYESPASPRLRGFLFQRR